MMMAAMEGGRRKRTSSLGSATTDASHRQESDEEDDGGIAFPTLSKIAVGGSHGSGSDYHHQHAAAWVGQRSGSAPPERSHRTPTTSSSTTATTSSSDDKFIFTTNSVSAGSTSNSTNTSLTTSDEEESRSTTEVSSEAQSLTSGDVLPPGGEGGIRDEEGNNGDVLMDQLLLDGLKVPKDRLLLLRSELEMDKFIHDESRHRLRVAPPCFPPNLNSYQRLLIHRLADLWSITRELEPASNAAALAHSSAPTAGSMITGTIVLVKNESTKAPAIRISSLAPPESLEVTAASLQLIALASKISSVSLDQSPKLAAKVVPETSSEAQAKIDAIVASTPLPVIPKSPSIGAASIPASFVSSTPSASSSSSPGPTPSVAPVRIMSRASQNGTSRSNKVSPSPSINGGTQGMTFEEREAAYQQARMRIFNASQQKQGSSATGTAADEVGSASGPMSTLHNASFQPQYPPEQAQFLQQHFQGAPQPSISHQMTSDTSAPVLVYHNMPGPSYQSMPEQQQQQQHFAYQFMGGHNVMPGPPIQVTMPSPSPYHMQQPHFPATIQQQSQQQLLQHGYDSTQPGLFHHMGQPIAGPSTSQYRPTSAHSHSSQSSLSTTTSASSIRTASTSSAQRSTLSVGRGYTSPGESLRSMRQGAQLGTVLRQTRVGNRHPANLSSAASNSSVQSRHSISSSSTSQSHAEDRSSSTRLPSSRTSDSNFSSPDRDLSLQDKQEPPRDLSQANLAGPHASLPTRPVWTNSDKSGASSGPASSSASSVSSVSSREQASASIDDDPLVSREDTHTPLSSTSGKPSARTFIEDKLNDLDSVTDLASVAEDESADARSTPLSLPAALPAEVKVSSIPLSDDNTRKDVRMVQDASASVSITKGTQKKAQASQAKPIEYPPLRYDKVKGWTSMREGDNTGSTALNGPGLGNIPSSPRYTGPSGRNTVTSSGFAPSSNHQRWPASPPNQPPPYQHHQARSLSQQSNQLPHMQQLPANGYGTSPQYIMMQVPGPPPAGMLPGQNTSVQPQQFPMQTNGQYVQAGQGAPQYQVNYNPAMSPPHAISSNGPIQALPGQYVQTQVYYQQPSQHISPQQVHHGYPQIGHGGPVLHHQGGMTASDMLANGEMLYSYDLPRPVPRSGATLFDPNARS